MFRVIALGYWAGEVIDRLRANGNYDDIRFVFCDTDKRQLMAHGNENDEHILLTGIAQCREEIHDDNELMTVLVTDLGDEVVSKFTIEIIYELWSYADHTYCFAGGAKTNSLGGNDQELEQIFKWITDYAEITVLQDNGRLHSGLDRYNGVVQLLRLILQHPRKGRSENRDELPFGVWATEKQLFMALNAMYSNNSAMESYYKAEVFSFHKNTHEY